MINVIFPLLRLGLENSTLEKENLSDFVFLRPEQWTEIGNVARKQGVLGIVIDGVEQLESSSYGFTRNLILAKKLEWIGEVLQLEQKNRKQTVVMEDLAGKWKNEGCRVMVMKGQANGTFYPKPNHRNPGDIDCYLFGEYNKGNEIAKSLGANVNEEWYKHSEIYYKDEIFENHQYFVHTRGGRRSKLLEKELENALEVDNTQFIHLSVDIVMPPVQWTAMFLTYHACGHFLTEGLRLKQILDWAMFLKQHQKEVDWKVFYEFCEQYHLRAFANAMTSIAYKYLGVEINHPSVIYESDYADKILKSTLDDDDYIYSIDGGGWKEKIHVVKNLFRYRWKYEEIYQESIWKQLWYYITGFIFKTEK